MLKVQITKRFLMFIGALVALALGALVFSMSAEAMDSVPEGLAELGIVVSGSEGDEDENGDGDASGPIRPPCNPVYHCHSGTVCVWEGPVQYCYEKETCHTHCSR